LSVPHLLEEGEAEEVRVVRIAQKNTTLDCLVIGIKRLLVFLVTVLSRTFVHRSGHGNMFFNIFFQNIREMSLVYFEKNFTLSLSKAFSDQFQCSTLGPTQCVRGA
jgi:hypothetical protein